MDRLRACVCRQSNCVGTLVSPPCHGHIATQATKSPEYVLLDTPRRNALGRTVGSNKTGARMNAPLICLTLYKWGGKSFILKKKREEKLRGNPDGLPAGAPRRHFTTKMHSSFPNSLEEFFRGVSRTNVPWRGR